ncbi:transmembrane protein 60 isoform X1 [Rhinolophus sinicus]|uniref:transmembrane protein 60 isoform X1 n=1 Tax=Rhinolophus sinicus TaxID=89399 RepID=UPI003D7B8E1D
MPLHTRQDPTHPQYSARGKEKKRGEGAREGAEGREAALGFGPSPSRIQDCDGSGGRLSLCHPPNDRRGPRLTPGRRCQRLPGKSPAVEGDALVSVPPPPSRPPLSSLVLLHPQDSVRTQRPPYRPPKHEGDAGSYHRSGRRAARRRLECAGDTEESNAAAAAAAAGDLGVTTRLRTGALPPQPSPHPLSRRILHWSLQSPRAGREGGGASRGRIRALAGLIGICGPNGTTDTPDCTLTDFPSSP